MAVRPEAVLSTVANSMSCRNAANRIMLSDCVVHILLLPIASTTYKFGSVEFPEKGSERRRNREVGEKDTLPGKKSGMSEL